MHVDSTGFYISIIFKNERVFISCLCGSLFLSFGANTCFSGEVLDPVSFLLGLLPVTFNLLARENFFVCAFKRYRCSSSNTIGLAFSDGVISVLDVDLAFVEAVDCGVFADVVASSVFGFIFPSRSLFPTILGIDWVVDMANGVSCVVDMDNGVGCVVDLANGVECLTSFFPFDAIDLGFSDVDLDALCVLFIFLGFSKLLGFRVDQLCWWRTIELVENDDDGLGLTGEEL
ncbi:hypothetical protein Sjap_008294 [Stephania japonica]|uniref:Uncharacterized protein n=1 Tax=Stephania japonica TaxID=461633 RepID=A0AAP0JRH5_9MAGN